MDSLRLNEKLVCRDYAGSNTRCGLMGSGALLGTPCRLRRSTLANSVHAGGLEVFRRVCGPRHDGSSHRLDHDLIAVVLDQLADERPALRDGHARLVQQRLACFPKFVFGQSWCWLDGIAVRTVRDGITFFSSLLFSGPLFVRTGCGQKAGRTEG